MHQVRSRPVIENWILPLVPHPTLMYAVVCKYVVTRFMSSLLLYGSICALTKLVCLLVQVSHVQSSGVKVPACEAAPESLADAAGQQLVMPTSCVATPAAASGPLADVAVTPYDDQLAAALDQACQVQTNTHCGTAQGIQNIALFAAAVTYWCLDQACHVHAADTVNLHRRCKTCTFGAAAV